MWIPPPRFSDRLNVVDESRESHCYIALQIIEAKVVLWSKFIFNIIDLFVIFTTTF